jgi:hypothetical protein
VASDKEFERTVKLNSVIGVRQSNAGVAIRIFRVEGGGGQEPKLFLKADAPGLRFGAARVAAYHYRGDATKLPNDHVRVGMIIVVAQCRNGGEFDALLARVRTARISDELSKSEWKAVARIGGLTLEASRNTKTRAQIRRSVNGKDLQLRVLSLNGEDLTKFLN